MPTTKQRINLSVTPAMSVVLQELAERDHTSVTTKTLDLVRIALELEEDAAFVALVDDREKVKGKFVSHADACV
ncbi:MAG: hypothetical protein AAB663_00905 [Patescibacteria group bacterium]